MFTVCRQVLTCSDSTGETHPFLAGVDLKEHLSLSGNFPVNLVMTSAFFLLTSAPVRVVSSHESFQMG